MDKKVNEIVKEVTEEYIEIEVKLFLKEETKKIKIYKNQEKFFVLFQKHFNCKNLKKRIQNKKTFTLFQNLRVDIPDFKAAREVACVISAKLLENVEVKQIFYHYFFQLCYKEKVNISIPLDIFEHLETVVNQCCESFK